MDTWFVSDTHWGHRNLLNFKKDDGTIMRPDNNGHPFVSIEAHDQTLIDNWNSVVSKGDRVYHLGDLAFCGKIRLHEIMNQLNGTKVLIMGNHDQMGASTYLKYFKDVRAYDRKYGYLLSHMPVRDIPQAGCLVNVHGHYHARENNSPNHLCVSVERTLMFPQSVDSLAAMIKKKNKLLTDHPYENPSNYWFV